MLVFWIAMGAFTNQRFFYTVLGILLISLLGSRVVFFVRKLPYPKFIPELVITAVVFAIFTFLLFTTAQRILNIPYTSNRPASNPEMSAPPADLSPDIYYIILDGYEFANAMKTYLNYDNSGFIAGLDARGFHVFKDSFSNYPRTILSLSSSLNMDYVDSFSGDISAQKEWWLLTNWMINNQVKATLESINYETIEITAWETATLGNNSLHPYLIETNEFEKFFISSTSLSYLELLLGNMIAFPSFDMHRKYVISGFEMIKEKSKEKGPKFIYAHIISPHPPFVFDKYGNPINPFYRYNTLDAAEFPGSRDEYRNGYVQQVQFVNEKTLDMIDEILKISSVPPIIIIQGDHGAGLYTDFFSPSASCMNEKFSILLAIYAPAIPKDSMQEYTTPVNIFRTIFNDYFGTNYELLPNRHYFVKGYQIYNYEDVTSSIFNTCDINK